MTNPYGGPVKTIPICVECERKDKRISKLELQAFKDAVELDYKDKRISELEVALADCRMRYELQKTSHKKSPG